MDEKNLFDRVDGQDIRGRIMRDQRSTIVDSEPMITEEYSDYQYDILEDKTDELEPKDSSSSSLEEEPRKMKSLGFEHDLLLGNTEESKKFKKDITNVTEKDTHNNKDMLYTFLNSAIDVRIAAKEGDLLRNNTVLQDKLSYIKNTVNKAIEAKNYEKQLNSLVDNPVEFNKVHNMYERAMREYYTMKPKSDEYLQELHEQSKDINGFSEISKLKGSTAFLNYLDDKMTKNAAEIEDKIQDINEDQGIKRYLNSMYQVSPEYQEKAANTKFAWTDPSTWKYTIPQSLGSSYGFIESTLVSMGASLAGNFALKQIPKIGMTGGASLAAGLAVSVGVSAANIWSNIAARQQESNAEVYDNYKSTIQEAGDAGKFDLNKVLEEGAQKLKELTGIEPTDMSQNEILDNIVMYNIPISDDNFNAIKDEARKGMDALYNQNMALAVSDVGQSLLVIPGVGKFMNKALTLNGKVKLGEDLGKFADKLIDNTTSSIARNMSKLKKVPILRNTTSAGLKRIVKRGLTPAAKLGISSIGEGYEEGVQYLRGKEFAQGLYNDKEIGVLESFINNFETGAKAYAGLLGISSDPALNDDLELANNMKLGIVNSLLQGGGSQVLMPNNDNVVKQYIDDITGSKVAKKLTADHIQAKEDMENIKRYTVDALNNPVKRDGYISQLESMKDNLPPGLSAEDIDLEIDRAKKVFNYINNDNFNGFAESIGISKGTDDYNTYLALAIRAEESAKNALDFFNQEKAEYDKIWARPEINQFFEENKIPQEQRQAYARLIRLNTERRALEEFVNFLEKFKGSNEELNKRFGITFNKDRAEDYIYETMNMRSKLLKDIERLEKSFKEDFDTNPIYDRIDDGDIEYDAIQQLPKIFLDALYTNELTSVRDVYRGIESYTNFGKRKLSAKNAIRNAIDKYNDVQRINEEINAELIRKSEEDTITETPDSKLGIDPVSIAQEKERRRAEAKRQTYEERISGKKKGKKTLADVRKKPVKRKPTLPEESVKPAAMGNTPVAPSINLDEIRSSVINNGLVDEHYTEIDSAVDSLLAEANGAVIDIRHKLEPDTYHKYVDSKGNPKKRERRYIENDLERSAELISELEDKSVLTNEEQELVDSYDELTSTMGAYDDSYRFNENLDKNRKKLDEAKNRFEKAVKAFKKEAEKTEEATPTQPKSEQPEKELTPEEVFGSMTEGFDSTTTPEEEKSNIPEGAPTVFEKKEETPVESTPTSAPKKEQSASDIFDQMQMGFAEDEISIDFNQIPETTSNEQEQNNEPEPTQQAEEASKVESTQQVEQSTEKIDANNQDADITVEDGIKILKPIIDKLNRSGFDSEPYKRNIHNGIGSLKSTDLRLSKEQVDKIIKNFKETLKIRSKLYSKIIEDAITDGTDATITHDNLIYLSALRKEFDKGVINEDDIITLLKSLLIYDDNLYNLNLALQNIYNYEYLENTETKESVSEEQPLETSNEPARQFTDEELALVEVTENDNATSEEAAMLDTAVEDESKKDFGLTSGTVYFSGKSMFPGFEDAKSFDEFLSTPGALEGADIRIVVGKPGAKYNERFVPSDRNTWDEAAIYVTVEKNGKKYAGALKTISGAKRLYETTGKALDQVDIDRLQEFRNEILEAYLKYGPDAVIKPNIVRLTNGLFNVNRKDGAAVRRPLTEVKGFNIPKDIRHLEDDGIVFGVGRGIINHYIIADKHDLRLPGVGGSGKIFIYPRPKDTPSGWAPPIKLNELRFSDRPDLAELIYKTLVEKANSIDPFELNINGKIVKADFTNADVVRFLINEGDHTLIKDQDDDRIQFLRSKQLYYDRSRNVYFVGNNVWTRSYLLSREGKEQFLKYLKDNLHINTPKDDGMFKKLPHEFYTTLYKHPELKELKLSDSLSFTREELDANERVGIFGKDPDNVNSLTQLQWMVKHGWLLSDLKDQLFTSPFLYVKGINVEIPQSTNDKAVEEITKASDPTNETDNPFLRDKDLMNELGFDLALPRPLVTEQASKQNTERSKKWLMDKLGLNEDQVVVTNGFVRVIANGSIVMGTTYRDCIVLSDATVPGVGYHEAFHRVSNLLISNTQQEKLYDEYRRRHPEYRNATKLEIEEALAEDFRAFMLKREKPIYSILKWFNPILTFIRKMFKPNAISTMYNMIADGNFAKYKMDQSRYEEYANAYKEGLNFTVGEGKNAYSPKSFSDLYDYYNSVIPALSAMLLIKNKVTRLSDVSKLKTSVLRDYLKQVFESTKNPKQRVAIKEILDHFDTVFMPDVVKELEKISIRAVDRDRDQEMEDKDSVNVQTIQNYDKASYEISKKDNALAGAKMFIATIPKVKFVYQEVNGVTVKSVVPELDPITGMLTFVDFDTSWNLLLNNLYNVETWDDLVKFSEEKAKESPFFYQLNKRLSRVTDTVLQTQLLQTVKSNKHNMFAVRYGTKPSVDGKGVQVYWYVDDSGSERASAALPAAWSQVFYNSNLVKISEEGTSLNVDLINNIKQKYLDIVGDIKKSDTVLTEAYVDSVIIKLVKLLNEVGITIDKETIDSLLTDPKISSTGSTRAASLVNMLTNVSNGSLHYLFNDNIADLAKGPKEYKTKKGSVVKSFSNVYENLGKNSIINLLAKHYAKVHPNPEEMMVVGAEGNLLYPISQNCYMSDQVRWLNQRGEALDQLNAVTYCGNSLIREALNQKHDIKLNTFVNFKSDRSDDRGRDYMNISPVEDYLAKMALTENNHIILPTMADKKMYFTITGVKLFNDPLNVVKDGNSLRILFSNRTISHFLKIGLDELNAIEEFYLNKDKTDANKDLRVKNYHTAKLGGRFRHFTHVVKDVNGKTELISLNEVLDKAEAAGNIMQTIANIRAKLFSDTSNPDYVVNTINGMLNYMLAAELVTAENMGIITRDDRGAYKNNTVIKGDKRAMAGLDQSRIKELKEYYERSEITRPFAEHYAVLTMIGNYAANSAASIIEVEKVFTGDSAFYKSTDDKIKRLSEVLSTGDNLRLDWPADHRLANRKTFTATELNDNEIASHQYDELKKLFTRSYARKYIKEFYGINEDILDEQVDRTDSKEVYKDAWNEAEKVASVAVDAYGFNTKKNKGNINQADAAVYIRPQMYRDLMEMLGEWSPEIERAFDIMESEPFGEDGWLSNPTLYHESLEALMKPLKMMYYGQHLVPELGIQVPIFDKMAMFPMFRVMATGDNRKLYERMNGVGEYEGLAPIDMVAFGSAVKVGSRSPGVFYTDAANNEISDLSKWSVFEQNFKYLRRQLITDPHHAERQMLGTQAAKAALSNLVMDRDYDGMLGSQIKETVFDCMNKLSNLGRQRIMEDIGDTDGNLNMDKLSDFLIRNGKSKGMDSEMLDGLQVKDGKFTIPLSAMSDSKWIESSIVGMTNREAIDVNMPGGAFIQMSSFGFKSINVNTTNSYNSGKRLNLRNPDGSMDAIISINLLSHIIPNYDKMSFLEAKQWLIDNHIIGTEGVGPIAMGYRIPTQGLSSIAALRIVDVYPSNVGDTITLPDEFTALTGSDQCRGLNQYNIKHCVNCWNI